MANSYAVVDLVTKEALRIAHEKLTLLGTVDRQYDSTFQYNSSAGKFGQTLRVRKPNQYTRRQGSRVMDVQDQDEQTGSITVATQDGVDMRFPSAELLQSVNNDAAFDDLSKNYIEPAMAVLCSGIEGDAFSYYTPKVWNLVGTPGTTPATLTPFGDARAKLNQNLAPKDRRMVQIDSLVSSAMSNALYTAQNPIRDISKQYREGMLTRIAMADFYENERTYAHLTGADHTTVTTTATAGVTDGGGTTITITGGTMTVGDVFTVAGVYQCHPETKQAYSHLQQFVVTGGTLNGALTVSPAIYLTGARQNVCSAAGAQLATTAFNSQVVTAVGTASTSYLQSIMYHPEAFQFVTADLPLYADSQKCARMQKDGLSIRVWMDSDIRNDELLMRLDILYGFAALRPEWAVRITS